MKPVFRLILLTLAAFLGSLFASPDAQAFSWKTAPDDEVRQHVDGQHENAGPGTEWKGEEHWVPAGKCAEQFFSGTLENAGETGPSAREQCRINGWLNYDTASGYTVAARNVPTPNRGPDFVVTPSGTAHPVPSGATGPTSTRAPGMQYTGGSGGPGMDSRTSGVRFMDATPHHNERVIYMNRSGQTVDPSTGRTIPPNHPRAHIPPD